MQLLKFKQKTQKFFNILKFHPVLMQWNQAALMRFFCSLWHENAFEKHFVFLCKGFSNLLLNQQILWCTVGNFLWIWLPSGKSYFQLKHIIMLHAFKVAYLICLYIVETEMFAHQKKKKHEHCWVGAASLLPSWAKINWQLWYDEVLTRKEGYKLIYMWKKDMVNLHFFQVPPYHELYIGLLPT